MNEIKSKIIVSISALFFLLALINFTYQHANAISGVLDDWDNPCYHCGSVEACLEGGEPYGISRCDINYDEWGSVEACVWPPGTAYCEQIPTEN